MAQAPRDANRVTTLLGTSNADGTTPIVIWADPVTHRLLCDVSISGGGTSAIDKAAFTVGTTTYTPVGGIYQASPDTLTTGTAGVLALDSKRNVQVVGPTASGVSIAQNPVTQGGRASTTNPTAVTDGQVVNARFDKLGSLVAVNSVRELKGNQITTITTSTSETTIITAVASTFLDLYGLIVSNTSASACNVAIKDATAGTTRMTIAVPAGDTRGFMLNESGGHNQATVNNNWTATCSASVTSIIITALFVRNT